MSLVYYRTKDGTTDFKFSFERQGDGSWRVYITDMPSYGMRATDAHTTHRLSDNGRPYICWSAPLRSEAEARQVAALWSDLTLTYIRTGMTIDQQAARRR